MNKDMNCILHLFLLFFSHGIRADFMGRNLISNTTFGVIIQLGFQHFRPWICFFIFRHLDLFFSTIVN